MIQYELTIKKDYIELSFYFDDYETMCAFMCTAIDNCGTQYEYAVKCVIPVNEKRGDCECKNSDF